MNPARLSHTEVRDPRVLALVEKAVHAGHIEPTVTRVRTCYDDQEPGALDWIAKGLIVACMAVAMVAGFIAGRAGALDWMVGR